MAEDAPFKVNCGLRQDEEKAEQGKACLLREWARHGNRWQACALALAMAVRSDNCLPRYRRSRC